MEPIILASSSPRRQEILKMLKIPFRIIIPNIDETLSSVIELEQVPELLAREKVTAVIHSLPAGQEIQWILGADTVILFDGKVIGKPETHEQAVEYLTALQGTSHTVLTALVLYNGHKKKTVSIRGKAIKLPEEEHFVFENHHEAIIPKETFELAQSIRKRKANSKSTCRNKK